MPFTLSLWRAEAMREQLASFWRQGFTYWATVMHFHTMTTLTGTMLFVSPKKKL